MKKKALVIGSGISGLSITRMLQENYEVKILEKADKIGGLIKCDRIDGSLFHLVGGHVFNSKNAEVLAWFWSNFDKEKEFLEADRNAKILLKDKIIGYPIENYIYQLPEDQIRSILKELLEILQKNTDPQKAPNFEVFLRESFGDTLFDTYFGPYNSKIWNISLSEIPLEWLEGKLPMPQIADTLLSNIIKKEEKNMVHSTFFYPIYNGSQFIVDRLAEGLDINISYTVTSIETENDMLSVNSGAYKADRLVYCGDIRRLSDIIKISDSEVNASLESVKSLLSNGTSNVLCETDDNDMSWLYLPDTKYLAHRIIYTGNFSKTNNGTNRTTCVVEFSGKHTQENLLKEISLLPGNLRAISFNYEPNSYIIHDLNTGNKIKTLKTQLQKYNIYLLGRFSEWEYYNMDKCIEGAMELASSLS